MTIDEAIEILNKVEALPCGYCYQGGKEFEEAIALAKNALNLYPIALNALGEKKPKGKWIIEDEANHTYKCPICGELACCKGSYCPDCGERLE